MTILLDLTSFALVMVVAILAIVITIQLDNRRRLCENSRRIRRLSIYLGMVDEVTGEEVRLSTKR